MAVLNLIGVLENGPQLGQPSRSLAAPDNPRVAIRLNQQTSLTINLQVLLASGGPVDLTAGTTKLIVSKVPRQRPLFTKTGVAVSPPVPNFVSFQIDPTDTLWQRVEFGRWCYAIKFTDADGNVNDVIPLSPFLIEANL